MNPELLKEAEAMLAGVDTIGTAAFNGAESWRAARTESLARKLAERDARLTESLRTAEQALAEATRENERLRAEIIHSKDIRWMESR